jgi:hypothetical protein
MLAAWERRNARQLGRPPRCRPESHAGEQPTNGRWRYPEAQFAHFAADPPMAPAQILPRQPHHDVPDLSRRGWASAPAGRLPPFPAHEARCHRSSVRGVTRRASRDGRGRWQAAAESTARSGARNCGPRDLAAQNIELVAQHQQLHVLDVQATTTPNQCAQQSPEREAEEGEGHDRRSSPFSRKRARHEYWRPSGWARTSIRTDPLQLGSAPGPSWHWRARPGDPGPAARGGVAVSPCWSAERGRRLVAVGQLPQGR